LVKALLARDLWNTSEFYQIINDTDKGLQKAVEIISDKKKYESQFKQRN